KAARAILKQLHGLLYPPVPDDQNAILIYQKAFDIAREKLGGLIPKGLDRTAYSAVFSGEEMSPEQVAALRAWFEKDEAALSEVNAVRKNPTRSDDEEFRKQALSPLAFQDMAVNVESMIEFSKLAERPYYETKSDLDALMCSHGELAPWYASLTQDTVRGMDGLSRVVARSEATTSMAKLSLELGRYRVKNTGYPESLDALKFKGLPDPCTGQPFIYRRDRIGFVLDRRVRDGVNDA